jgi:hypothetical protein
MKVENEDRRFSECRASCVGWWLVGKHATLGECISPMRRARTGGERVCVQYDLFHYLELATWPQHESIGVLWWVELLN